MEQKEIRQKVIEGRVHSRIIIEVLGAPKEHVEKTIRDYVEKLKHDENVEVLKEYFSDAEQKKKFFAVFVELELLVKSPEHLTWLCFDYMPSSIEIMDPEEFKFKSLDFAQFLNDLQARLHNIDMRLKNANAEARLMRNNMDALMQNFVYLSLKHSDKSLEELAKELGIEVKFAKMVLDKLLKRNAIQEKEGIYSITKKEGVN